MIDPVPTAQKPAVRHRLRRATALAAALALAAASLPVLPVAADAQSASGHVVISEASATRILNLGLDKSLVVDLPTEAHDILVANPQVADAVMRTSRRIYLFGKKVGQTNIFVFDGKGRQVASLDIRIERDIAGLEAMLARYIPHSEIRAEMMSDNVVLTGSVATAQDSAKAASLARVFVEGGEATQGNFQSGFFSRPQQSQIVNLLQIQGDDQVQLKVTIAEVSRSIAKQLGLSTNILSNAGESGFSFSSLSGGTPSLTNGAPNLVDMNWATGLRTIQSQLQALDSTGLLRTLAEPTLTAVSGEEAHFRVGGTTNVVDSVETDSDTNQTVVEFKELAYGVALTFTPTVLGPGRIALKIRTEVREPTPQGQATMRRDFNSPGVRERIASTSVELPSGGSMVIAGLVQDEMRQVVSGLPGIKDVPILGTLFRSREFVRNETEVVIVVTPYLVRPVARSKIALPDEGFDPASDATGTFMGRLNKVYGTKQGNRPKGRYTGSIGFILK